MFRRLYETRFRSVILFGIIASAALAIAWASISVAQTATSGERAQRWLNDDFSQDQNMATISTDTISLVCNTLSNPDERNKCWDNAQAAKATATTPEQPDPEEGEEAETSCAIEGVGWLLCPSLNFLANIADRAYAFLADSFLVIETKLINTESSGNTGTFDAWRSMLGIANATFIIFFLFIIYSQITGAGLSNYNLKKMLPRLIVAAILVNVSFYICQIAVDLSNILGRGIEQLFASLGNQMNVSPPGTIDSTADWSSSSNWVGTTITVLAGGVAIYLAMPFLAGGLLVGVVALLTVGFLLIARKALIVLLIVIAPLAFVAFLLPNTEKWFNKWRSLFASMLLVFPVVSLLFGAGKLAGGILGSAAGSDVIMQIVSQVVVVIPLFAVWGVMRKSMEAAGAIGAKINGIGTKMQGSAKSAGNKAYENSRIGQFKRYRSQEAAKRRSLIQAGAYKGSGKNPLNWQRNIRSGLNRGVNKIIPGRFGTRSAAAGIALANKEDATLIEQEMALMASTADPKTQLTEAASILESASKSGDVVRARAAQKILLNSGAPGLDTLHTTLSGLESSGGLSNKMSSVLRSDIQSSGIKGKDSVLNNWTYDKKSRSIAELELSADPYDGLNPVELAGQSAKNLKLGVANSLITPQAAQQVLQSEQASGLLSAEKRKIFTNLAQNPQPRRAAGGSVAAPQAAPRTPVQPQAPQPVPPVAPNNQPAQNQARAGQAPAGTGGTPQQPTATLNLNNRQAQAQARINAAAQGTAGTSTFFVASDGTTANTAGLATGSVKEAQAAQGTSGDQTRVFSVDESGVATEQTLAGDAGVTIDHSGRQTPGTVSSDDTDD